METCSSADGESRVASGNGRRPCKRHLSTLPRFASRSSSEKMRALPTLLYC